MLGRILTTVLVLLAVGFAHAATKTFTIMDNQGFEAPMEAFTIEVPSDWSVSGEVVWAKPCSGNPNFETVFTARSPDGRTGFRMMPGHQVVWMEAVPTGFPPDIAYLLHAQTEAQLNEMRTRFRNSNCHVGRVTGTDQLLKALVLDQRPAGTKVIRSERMQQLVDTYRSIFQTAAAPGMSTFYDAVAVTLAHSATGTEIEESLMLAWYMFQLDAPVGGPGTFSQTTIVESLRVGWIAPERRAADEAVLEAIVKSVKTGLDWEKKVNAFLTEQAAKRREEQQQQFDERQMQTKIEEARRDQQFQQFIEYIRE